MSKRLTIQHFEKLCEERNHALISFGDYSGIKSILQFKCNVCDHEWSSTAGSYKNSKTGCWGCKKIKISLMTKTRVFTEEGRERISISRKGKSSWNKGIKGSVPGGGNPHATRIPTPEQRLLPGTLYLIRYLDESGTHFKIGITQRKLSQRFTSLELASIIHLHHATLGECFDLEQSTLKWAKSQGYRYSSPTTTELLRPEAYTRVLDLIKLRSVTKSYTSNGITTDTFRTASNL